MNDPLHTRIASLWAADVQPVEDHIGLRLPDDYRAPPPPPLGGAQAAGSQNARSVVLAMLYLDHASGERRLHRPAPERKKTPSSLPLPGGASSTAPSK